MNDLISRQAAISAIVGMTTMGVEELVVAGDKEKYDWIKGLSDSLVKIINLPSVQPEYEELTPEEAASEIASGSITSAWSWFNTMIRLKQMGYAICRKK